MSRQSNRGVEAKKVVSKNRDADLYACLGMREFWLFLDLDLSSKDSLHMEWYSNLGFFFISRATSYSLSPMVQ